MLSKTRSHPEKSLPSTSAVFREEIKELQRLLNASGGRQSHRIPIKVFFRINHSGAAAVRTEEAETDERNPHYDSLSARLSLFPPLSGVSPAFKPSAEVCHTQE